MHSPVNVKKNGIFVSHVEEITYCVNDVGKLKSQMLGKPPCYFDFLSFSRPMARREYEP
jgi:hypothetical protein